jgi:hypothetical protein
MPAPLPPDFGKREGIYIYETFKPKIEITFKSDVVFQSLGQSVRISVNN